MLALRIPKRTISLFARAGAVLATAVLLGGGSHASGSSAGQGPLSHKSTTTTQPGLSGLGLSGLGPLALAERLAARTSLPDPSPAARPSAALRELPGRVDARPARPSKVLPVSGSITGLFGEIRGGGRPHAGVDLDGEIGDPVGSAGAGLVVHAGPPPQGWSGYGNLVVVNHPDGTYAMYAHLSAVAVPAGTVVEPGRLIGAIGVSGSVTGSHLHWEMRFGETPIDPIAWVRT